MSVNLPATTWQPGNNNGEMGTSEAENIQTISGLNIVTLSSANQLVTKESTYTPLASTEWVQDDGA